MENWLEWLGYLASLIVLISLLMSSIIRLRWVNLLGSVIFAVYGFLIGSLPVGFMNLCTCGINIYYLVKMYRTKEYFKILSFENKTPYLDYFLDYYKSEIEKHTNKTQFQIEDTNVNFFILRNMVTAGIFIASKYNENTLNIQLDFVIPEYRDFKIGNFIFEDCKDYFIKRGYTRFVCATTNVNLIKYLGKMGFVETVEQGNKYFVKEI